MPNNNNAVIIEETVGPDKPKTDYRRIVDSLEGLSIDQITKFQKIINQHILLKRLCYDDLVKLSKHVNNWLADHRTLHY